MKVNQFKVWLLQNGVTQIQLSEKTGLGITTLHHLINEGQGSEKTISKIAVCLKDMGKDISENDIQVMLNSIN